MAAVVSLIGHHNSGKTQLITRLIPELAARGLRVGTVKHAPRLEAVDTAQADSAQHLEAGSARVLLWGADAYAEFSPLGEASLGVEIVRRFADCDVVLLEGAKHGPYPKIEVFRRRADLPLQPLAGEIDVAAVVTNDRVALPDGVLTFRTSAVAEIADLVEDLAFGDDGDDRLRSDPSYASLDP